MALNVLISFKEQLIKFMDELIDTFPGEADFVIFRIFLKDQIPIQEVMNYVVKDLLPKKEIIFSKNETFFLENNVLFNNFDKTKSSKVNHFRKLWTSENIDSDTKEAIWNWFILFVKLAEKYKLATDK